MINKTQMNTEAKAWVKKQTGPDEVIRIVPDVKNGEPVLCYLLYTAFDSTPDYLGRILFDNQGYWIYDGTILSISEQEQVAKFIINYVEVL